MECAVQGLLLDELELASLRGEVQEASLSLNLESRLGRAVVAVAGPRFSGLQGQSLSGAFRWERDVVRLERAVLQQANSRCVAHAGMLRAHAVMLLLGNVYLVQRVLSCGSSARRPTPGACHMLACSLHLLACSSLAMLILCRRCSCGRSMLPAGCWGFNRTLPHNYLIKPLMLWVCPPDA